MSNWFRDYLYKPLGGSKRGRARVLFNLAATMFLSGLWHGAAWNFVLWGLFHGFLLLLHHQLRGRRPFAWLRERAPRLQTGLGWLWTLHVVVLGWLLFRVEALADLEPLLRAAGRALSGSEGIHASELGCILAFYAFVGWTALARRGRWLARIDAHLGLSLLVYGVLASAAILLAREQASVFVYFQF